MADPLDAAPYPRFSDGEMARRHDVLAEAMAEHGVAHTLVYGANRAGSAVGWLTRWPVTREALVLVTPGEPLGGPAPDGGGSRGAAKARRGG